MFRPNTTALLHRKLDRRTAFGKAIFTPPVQIEMAVVTLGSLVEDSTVRADSSASRGSAEIETASAKLLLPAIVIVSKGDVIEYAGDLIEVTGIRRRNDVTGHLDHWEVIGSHKASM